MWMVIAKSFVMSSVYRNMHIGKWSVVQVIIYENCMFMGMGRYQYELVPFIPYKYSKSFII